jgi:hypothetical protein
LNISKPQNTCPIKYFSSQGLSFYQTLVFDIHFLNTLFNVFFSFFYLFSYSFILHQGESLKDGLYNKVLVHTVDAQPRIIVAWRVLERSQGDGSQHLSKGLVQVCVRQRSLETVSSSSAIA